MVEITTSDIIRGLAIGGILLWLATRKSDVQPNNGLQQQSEQAGIAGQREQMQIGIYGWKPLDHIQNFDDFNSKIIQTTIQPIIQSSTQTVEQVPKEVEQPVSQIVQQDSQIAQQDSQIVEQESNSATEYGNKETWKILRNPDGDIETIEVQRSARVDVRK